MNYEELDCDQNQSDQWAAKLIGYDLDQKGAQESKGKIGT